MISLKCLKTVDNLQKKVNRKMVHKYATTSRIKINKAGTIIAAMINN